MSKKVKQVKETRKTHHQLGSPEFYGEVEYLKDNAEYTIILHANGSNTHFFGKDVQMDDTLQLGMDERSFEALIECGISAISDRLENKLKLYNNYKKAYYMTELDGSEKEFQKSNWNSFKK